MPLVRATSVSKSLYVTGASLQQGFIDKDSGLELAFGYINFFRDVDHSARKPIYSIGGPPDDPVFTELPNPLILSAIGTFIDPNTQQDIIPYYKPYDEEGNIDLYYIEVYSAGDVLQFTRDHFPDVQEDINPDVELVDNLLPNGQWLMHQDTGVVDAKVEVVPIAYGNWRFLQTPDSSSVNAVYFDRYNSPSDSPDQNPRYSLRIDCTVANPADTEKQFYCMIHNVNFMQGQDATLQFTAYSNDGNNHNVSFLINKNYGLGGSPPTSELIETVLVTPEIQNFLINFTMSSNIGKTLGSDSSDTIYVTIQSPLATISSISYVDMMMVAGTFDALTYPPTPPAQDKSFTLGGSLSTPAYDGSDFGKFVRVAYDTSTDGLGYDYQQIYIAGMMALGTPYNQNSGSIALVPLDFEVFASAMTTNITTHQITIEEYGNYQINAGALTEYVSGDPAYEVNLYININMVQYALHPTELVFNLYQLSPGELIYLSIEIVPIDLPSTTVTVTAARLEVQFIAPLST